jgi:putative hydrolase of the HAD superfamily
VSALPAAILFDLDDTIIHAGVREGVLVEIARSFAGELSPLACEAVAAELEAAMAAYWSDPERHKQGRFALAEVRRRVMAQAFAANGAAHLTEDLAHRFADRFTAARDAMTATFPGAIEAVAALQARGVRLGLITNGDGATQRAKIARFGLATYFAHIQIEGEAGFGKPERRAYEHALAALGVGADDCWIVGDDLEWEVAAPQRLGLHAIWHDPHGRGLPDGSAVQPDRIIRALSELLT